jgi:ADP-ribose pyrophosphatase
MKIIKRKIFYKNKHIKLIKKEFLGKDKNRNIWWCAERKEGVIIFALTKQKEVILERGWRVPRENFVIELPAGILDRKGENKKNAAKRELYEETGYLAKKIIPVFSFPIEQSFLVQDAHLFFAPDVVFSGKRNLDNTEEIEVIKVPLKKLSDFLLRLSKNTKVDIKIFSAIQILKEKGLI